MIALGYIFTVINYVLYCASRFAVSKKTILLMDLVAKVFTVMGLYCLNSLSGAAVFCITFVLLIAANIKERLDKKCLWGFIVFQALYTIALFYTYDGISSILVFLSATINLLCIWWFAPQNMRLVGGFNCIIYLAYQISIKNWAGLIEILVLISNFAAYIKYHKDTPKNIDK